MKIKNIANALKQLYTSKTKKCTQSLQYFDVSEISNDYV